MTDNSPTCILSSSCLRGPHTDRLHRDYVEDIAAVYSDVVSASSDSEDKKTAFGDRCCHRQSPGGPALPGDSANYWPVTIATTVLKSEKSTEEDSCVDESLLTPSKSSKASRIAAWKTSKFFSKSMSSAELLKSLRKISLTSSTDDPEDKSLKRKLINLKKRSSCGNEDISVDADAVEAAYKNEKQAPKSPGPTADSSSSQKMSFDEGIVCKKEDLKAIICGASKRNPLCSPRKKNVLRQTKSASFEPQKDKKEPVRRAGSEESRSRKTLVSVENDSPKVENKLNVTKPVTPASPKELICSTSPTIKTPKIEKKNIISDASSPFVSAVKWDECEVVDAVLIGDAIENFLKGSMSGTEKKVCFRKNSTEKKS